MELIRLSAAIAARDKASLTDAMEAALAAADPGQIEEAILQSYLFLGFPICLNAFALWRRLSGRPGGEMAEISLQKWAARGGEVCGAVYAGQFDRLKDNIRALHPDMERWMVIEGYGKVLGRPELPLDVRELCIVGLLAVLGVPKQLYSHLRGALNVGASVDRIVAALEVAAEFLDEDERRQALRTWDKVLERSEHASVEAKGGGS
jgi:4-carboxymuconolactone decarboxylase